MRERKSLFKVDDFIRRYAQQNTQIESGHIAKWIKCSLRYVQKWAKNNNIDFKRNHGRKYYAWPDNDIRKFAEWYNRKNTGNAEIKKQGNENANDGIEKETKVKASKRVQFKTIEDYAESKSGRRLRQMWAKAHDVEYGCHFGRKYYVWSDELEDKFNSRVYRVHWIGKKKKYGSRYIASCLNVDVDIETVRRWAKRHRLPYITNCKKFIISERQKARVITGHRKNIYYKKRMIAYDLHCGGKVRHVKEEEKNMDKTVWRDINDRKKAYVWDFNTGNEFINEYIEINN